MNKLLIPLALAVLSIPAMPAQSVFEGTWKIQMDKVDFPKEPDVYLLQNGMYECKTCVPPVAVKADGTDQPVTGHPYFDSVAIKVVNDHQIQETDKKNGKVVTTSTTTASPDGKTVKFEFEDSSNTNGGAPVSGHGEAALVEKGPAGSHAISGSWRTTKLEGLSDNAIAWTYKMDGDRIVMTNPTGQTYTAKLDGVEAPMKGDPGVTGVEVRLIGSDTLEETDKREGKVIGVFRLTVGADGKTATAVFEDKLQNRKTTASVMKQ